MIFKKKKKIIIIILLLIKLINKKIKHDYWVHVYKLILLLLKFFK